MNRGIYSIRGVWVEENVDFCAYGPPETRVEALGDLTLGLYIPHPFGAGSDATLVIHATETREKGGEITLAIGTLIGVDTQSVDMRQPHQSNPRRKWWRRDHGYGHVEEDGS